MEEPMRYARMGSLALVTVLVGAAAAQEGEGKKKPSPELKGSIQLIDADGGTISIRRGGESAWDYNLKIAAGVAVTIDGRKAKLSEVKEGMAVTCVLSEDHEGVLSLRVESRQQGDREGEGKREVKREGDREGEGKREVKRDGDREGEGKREVKREGDREGEGKQEVKREGDREGEGDRKREVKREGDREGEGKRDADREEGEREEGAGPKGERDE